MSFASNLQNVALRLLTDKGETITFRRHTVGSYNVSTGGVDPVTSTTFTGVGHPSNYELREIDGTRVQANDVSLLVYVTTEPDMEDIVTIDSVNYKIQQINKIRAQGTNIVYRLQLRV